jgi:DNA recombination protein RmuC
VIHYYLSLEEVRYALCAAAGLVIGSIVAWLVTASRSKASFSAKVSGAESLIEELRNQIRKAEEDFSVLRATLEIERDAKVKAETQLDETIKRLEEEKKLLEDARAKLTDTFKALSDDALKSNNQAFLELAKGTLDKLMVEAKGDLEKRQEAIGGLIKPLGESLKQYEEHIKDLEGKRIKAYSSIDEQIKNLLTSQQQLQKETGNLVTALRTPHVRGRWGEITFKRVAELAGMSEHCDFTEQFSMESDTGRIRPDFIVHLPGEREIIVDVKTALDAYQEAVSAESEEQRKECLTRHAKQIRTHMNKLGEKAYWDQFDKAPEFVVMFIPGESFLSAAIDCDHALIEDGIKKQIILATPTTLIALLRAIAYGWRQEQITKNAQEISNLGKQLYNRMRVLANYINEIGNGLEKATVSYNKAAKSMEARVFPSARRFKELGTTSDSDISAIKPVEPTILPLNLPESPKES